MTHRPRFRGSLLAMICLSLFALALPALSITLVNNGQTSYVIAKQTNCDSTTSQAATDLRNYLQAISGATLTINSYADMSTVPAQAIVIGNLITSPTLALEQVEMKVSGDRLILRGGSSLAHRYAVFAFLEEELGCRYYSPTVEHVPSMTTITVDNNYDGTHTPSFEYRYLYQQDATSNTTWCIKNRVNGQVAINGTHNLFEFVPPGTYYSQHPEYYPLNGGVRTYSTSKQWLCWTNQDLPQIIANTVISRMGSTNANTIINVGQGDDYGNYCECQACQTAYAEEGNAWSGVMLQCLNAAADIVAQTYPNRKMMTFAYMHTEKPPSTTAPRSNLIIRLCHWRYCDLHGLEACSAQATFRSRLATWKNLTDPEQLYIWHYSTNYKSPVAPWPNVRGLIPDIQYYWDNDVRGLYYQGVYWAKGGDLSWLKLYLQAKAMWNKDVNAATVYNDFLTGYYGAAAADMDDYINLLEDQVANWHPNGITVTLDQIKSNVLPTAVFTQADAIYDAAEAAALNVSQALFDRVRFDRTSLLFMHIYNKQWLGRYDSPADRIAKFGDDNYYKWKTDFFNTIGDRGAGGEYSSGTRTRLNLMPQQAGDVFSIENDAIKVSVCPWIQGAIVGLLDKRTGKELLHHARRYYDTSTDYTDTPFNGFFWGENFHNTTPAPMTRESALDADCSIDTLPDGSQTITLSYGIGVGSWSPSTPTRLCTKIITLPPSGASFTVSEKRKNIDTGAKSAERLKGRLFLGGDTFYNDILVTQPDDSTATITTFPTILDAKQVAFDNTEFGVRLTLDFTSMPASPSSLTVGRDNLYSFNTITGIVDCGAFSLAVNEEKELFNVTCTLSEINATPASGNPVAWTDLRNTFVDPQFGGLLYKNAGGAAYNADAVSSRMMYSDGYVEWKFATNGQGQTVGLNPTNPDDGRTIKYAIRTYASGGVNYAVAWETNADRGTPQAIQPLDVFRVERVGSTIYYKRNGTTFHTSTVPSTEPLMVDTCLYNTGAYNGIYHCRLSAVNLLPSVTLTAPGSGLLMVGNTLTVSADAEDLDGAVTRVEFYAGDTKIGEVSASPYSFNWAVPAGSHVLTAKAFDNDGDSTTSEPIGITVWNTQDIGSPGTAGSTTYNSDTGVYTLKAAGAGLFGTADACHYAYQRISGDCTITARVVSDSSVYSTARVGVMVRESLDAGSKEFASVYMRYTPRVYRHYRTTTDDSTSTNNVNVGALPYWVRLVRSGNSFTCFRSPDGDTWTAVGASPISISMSDPVYIGLTANSGQTTLRTFTVDNVTITQP